MAFDARGYFNKTTHSDRQDEFGFTLGGPVRIPHLYNGTDQTFFFDADYYRTKGGGETSIISLPTDAMRHGDISALLASGQVIYDPETTQTSGTTATRTPFPGNIIPRVRTNPVAQKILSYVPPTTSQNIVNNSILPNSSTYTNFSTYSAKVDHYLNQATILTQRISIPAIRTPPFLLLFRIQLWAFLSFSPACFILPDSVITGRCAPRCSISFASVITGSTFRSLLQMRMPAGHLH